MADFGIGEFFATFFGEAGVAEGAGLGAEAGAGGVAEGTVGAGGGGIGNAGVAVGKGVYASAAITAGSSVYSMSKQKSAADAQRRGLREQQRMAEMKNQQEIRSQIRQERIKRASILQSAENVGGGDSSGAMGGAGSVTSQAGANLSFLDSMSSLNASSNMFSNQAASYASQAAIGKGVASIFSPGEDGWRRVGQGIFAATNKK